MGPTGEFMGIIGLSVTIVSSIFKLVGKLLTYFIIFTAIVWACGVVGSILKF
jgi:hypothetical protein